MKILSTLDYIIPNPVHSAQVICSLSPFRWARYAGGVSILVFTHSVTYA